MTTLNNLTPTEKKVSKLENGYKVWDSLSPMERYNKVMKNFRGYKQSKLPKSDETISQTDPGTSCGEYLRRYWHPVSLTSAVTYC